MPASPTAAHRGGRRGLWRACLVLLLASATALDAEDEPLLVRYRSAESVYVNAGRMRDVEVGARFAVIRADQTIAEIEVVFVADHSASCRILDERQKIAAGDHLRRIQPTSPKAADPASGMHGEDGSLPPPSATVSESEDVLQEIERQRNPTSWEPELPVSPGPAVRGYRVRFRSSDILYIDAGEGEGLTVGDPLEVLREGRIIAFARVATTTGSSAAASLLAEYETVQIDDLVRPTEAAEAAAGVIGPSRRPAELQATGSAELALDTRPVAPVRWRERKQRRAHTTVRGTMTLDWETFTDEADGEKFNYDRADAYLNLRVRDIGGLPYELRVRIRTQQNQRSQSGDAGSAQRESRNRYYELSLTYDPPQGRYSYRIGRLSSSPFIGIGYIDGALGQMALSSIVEVGAFAGSASDVEDLAPTDSKQRYGIFTRFTSPKTDSSLPWEVILAGVREQAKEGVSREFLTLQSRYSAKKWSIYQRAELDVNSGWRRELSGKSSQLSNFSLTATGRFSRYARLSLSYDLFEQYRTAETRFLPEELFNGFQRQGIRANLQVGRPRGLNVSLNAGFRDQEGESENTLSYGVGLHHGNVASWGLSLGLDLLGFSNQFTEGYTTTLRASKRLAGSHQVRLTLGNRQSRSVLFDEETERSTQWARLGGWFELPKNLFANAEYEVAAGDDIQGQRLSLSLGYRF